MSTSPSWFDQEKFSRLVKKVGPKNGPEVTNPPVPPAPEGEAVPGQDAPLASTARISLVSRPPSLLNENRALPALPRRTAPMPGLKSIFKYPPAESTPTAPAEPKPELKSSRLPPLEKTESAPEPELPVEESKPEPKFEFKFEPKPDSKPEPKSAPKEEPKFEFKPESTFDFKPEPKEELPPLPTEFSSIPPHFTSEEDLDAIWQKMALLNEELAQTIRERDQSFHDVALLRDQLDIVEKTLEQKEKSSSIPNKTQELTILTQERDIARKEYAELRKQFETLKREQNPNPREDSLKFRKELEQQLEGFRTKLEERNKEILALKSGGGSAPNPAATQSFGDIASLRDQLSKAKEEASIAQRGLALSQKALHETRMTLREATEGTSLSRHNFDNLKAECAALTQQNTILQAQNDQLARELAAAKSKLTTRL